MSTSQLSPGTVVDGKFTVGAVVRTRAGSTTYEANDANAVPCMVTVYDGTCFASGLALERSLRELRQLQSVHSPRVIKVHAAGKHGDGVFEVTDPLPAQTLADHLTAGALSLNDGATLIVQVGEALLEAQRVGVIHRNLGADVVFPTPEGARVSGFAVGEPQSRGAGPLHTIAPEQVQGKIVDQRTLIYNVAALMQWVLTGAPLFSGTPDEVLNAHEGQVPSADIDAKLRRALGKDPRMRPMMLKQFLHDIAELGGVQAPQLTARVPRSSSSPRAPIAAPKSNEKEAARPSSRGWTMFMTAQDGEKKDTPAPEAKPVSKPSTRGWTMFMEAQDEAKGDEAKGDEVKSDGESEQSGGKPSTRGWTMFMEDDSKDDAGSDSEATETAQAKTPSSEPTTRGWTMFTKDEDEEEEKQALLAAAPPAAAPPAAAPPAAAPPAAAAPVPEAAPPAAAPAVDTNEAPQPTTRGWTMFTKDEDEEAQKQEMLATAPAVEGTKPAAPSLEPPTAEPPTAPSAAAPSPAQTPASPEADLDAAKPVEKASSGPAKSPSSRGWTMFMEPVKGPAGASNPAASPGADASQAASVDASSSSQAAEPDAAAQLEAPEPEASSPEAASAEPAVDADTDTEGDEAEAASSLPAGKKRGWTMFMNAPLADLESPTRPSEAAKAKAEAALEAPLEEPVESADRKGWTVFGEPGVDAAKREQADSLAKGPPTPVGGVPAADQPQTSASGPISVTTDSGPVPVAGPGPADSGAGRGQTLLVTEGPHAPATPMPEPAPVDPVVASGKTLVNTGPPPEPAADTSISRGQTLLAGQQGLPDTMYFKKGEADPRSDEVPVAAETPAEGGVSPRGPTVRDVRAAPVPKAIPAVDERDSRGAMVHSQPSVPVAPSPAELQPVKSSNTALYVVAGVVAVVAAVAAFFAFS